MDVRAFTVTASIPTKLALLARHHLDSVLLPAFVVTNTKRRSVAKRLGIFSFYILNLHKQECERYSCIKTIQGENATVF